jgi:hypothetical protein
VNFRPTGVFLLFKSFADFVFFFDPLAFGNVAAIVGLRTLLGTFLIDAPIIASVPRSMLSRRSFERVEETPRWKTNYYQPHSDSKRVTTFQKSGENYKQTKIGHAHVEHAQHEAEHLIDTFHDRAATRTGARGSMQLRITFGANRSSYLLCLNHVKVLVFTRNLRRRQRVKTGRAHLLAAVDLHRCTLKSLLASFANHGAWPPSSLTCFETFSSSLTCAAPTSSKIWVSIA